MWGSVRQCGLPSKFGRRETCGPTRAGQPRYARNTTAPRRHSSPTVPTRCGRARSRSSCRARGEPASSACNRIECGRGIERCALEQTSARDERVPPRETALTSERTAREQRAPTTNRVEGWSWFGLPAALPGTWGRNARAEQHRRHADVGAMPNIELCNQAPHRSLRALCHTAAQPEARTITALRRAADRAAPGVSYPTTTRQTRARRRATPSADCRPTAWRCRLRYSRVLAARE